MVKVVVIDDDEAVRALVERVLRDEGYQVRAFDDGAPFLDSDAVNWADLIITDLLMPTSGELVLRAVREKRPLLPVILLSGSVTEERAVILTQLGAQEILTKPFHLDDFLLCVVRWSCELERR